LVVSEDGCDRSISLDEVVNDALREGGGTGVGRTTVYMHQCVTASVGDQITVPWHFDVTGVFPEEGDRGDTPALKWEGFAVSQLDHAGEAQFSQQRRVVVIQLSAVLAARYDDRDVLRHGQQCSRVHMVVGVMREEDGGLARGRR